MEEALKTRVWFVLKKWIRAHDERIAACRCRTWEDQTLALGTKMLPSNRVDRCRSPVLVQQKPLIQCASLSLMYMNDQSHLFGRYQSKSSAVCACALFVCPTSVPTFVNEIGPRHKRDRLADDNDFY